MDDSSEGRGPEESPEERSAGGPADGGSGRGSDDGSAPGASTGETDEEPAASEDDPVEKNDESERDEASARSAESEAEDAVEGTAASDGEPAANTAGEDDAAMPGIPDPETGEVPDDVAKYDRFKKVDGAQYDRVNEFLRDRTYITAREWAIARLCSDFRTETGVEMTKIGENLPELVPFMTDTYTPQAVNQARASFEEKVRMAGATFLYGAMSDFFTAEELDDVMYEATEVAKFLLEVEGVDLSVEEELEAEERISSVMREVREASEQLREEEAGGD